VLCGPVVRKLRDRPSDPPFRIADAETAGEGASEAAIVRRLIEIAKSAFDIR